MRVRLQDVAERASVSMQTVSRVMRTPHLVAPETVERVRAAMEALGYVKNEQATALRLGHTRTIGLLLPLLTMPFWTEVAVGAEALAHKRGYSLLLCDTSDSLLKEEDYIALLLGYQVAGIIYAHPRCRPNIHPSCATLIQSDTPVVVISVIQDDLPYPHVHTDDQRAGYVMVRHFLDIGRKRIAFVANNHESSLERIRGAHRALHESDIAGETSPVFFTTETYEGGRVAGQEIVSADGSLPDAIFATTDSITFGLLEALRSHGIRVPEDVAVASHDGLAASAFVIPSLTTIAPRAREMGMVCVDRLLSEEKALDARSLHVVEADLFVRASTAGPEYAAMDSLPTPISDPEAWACWRTRSAPPDAERVAVTRIPLDRILDSKEIDLAF
ncbi:MAG: LacI family DNA-binding transcriptional regulator [Ktedonobacteraceae bacterium]|nr:LacI family DNA-binding transcriptional regulator [Ktedonobacteraceae bacterium]